MPKRKGPHIAIIIFAIIGVVAVIGYLWPGLIPGAEVTLPTGGQRIDTPSGDVACPDTLLTKVGVYGVESVLGSNDQETVISTNATARVYTNGETQAHDTITLSNAGTQFSTSGYELACGKDVARLIVGNDTADAGAQYYLEEKDIGIAESSEMKYKFVLDKIGSLSLTASNGTAFEIAGATAETGVRIGMAAGETSTAIILKIKENSGAVVRKPVVYINYSTTTFEEVSIVGGSETDTATRLAEFEKAYTTGVDKVVNYDFVEKTLKVKTKSGASAGQYPVSIRVIDEGTYVQNGKVLYGHEDFNDADRGAADATIWVNVTVA